MSVFNSASEARKLPKILCGGLFVAGLATLVYWPSLKGAFIIDDNQYVTQNPNVYLSDGLARIWLARQQPEYYPVSYSVFWLERRLWGLNPTGYRAINLGLHIAAALLLWATLRKLLIPGGFLAALLLAVHPANVESVAWVFECRGLLAMALGLCSILCYLQADRRFSASSPSANSSQLPLEGAPRSFTWEWYALSLFAYALAILSKASVTTLPVILLVLVWWKDRIRSGDLVRIAPFFVVTGVVNGFNLWLQAHSLQVFRSATFCEHLAGAGEVVWFYLSKILLPVNLSFTYPQWQIRVGNLLWWLPLFGALGVTAVLFLHSANRWCRAVLLAWGVFVAALAPVMGFTYLGGFGHSLVWDHYLYFAMLAPTSLAAAAFAKWHGMSQKPGWISSLAAALVCILSVLTWQRSLLFGSPVNLYQDAVVKNPESWLANVSFASALAQSARTDEAIELLRRVVKTWPDFTEGYHRLGFILLATGRLQEAAECYRQAVRFAPDSPVAHNGLGLALSRADQIPEGIAQFQEALRLKPDFADAHLNLGVALCKSGQLQDGLMHLEQALRLNPDSIDACTNMTQAYVLLNRPADAIASAEKALELARAQGRSAETGELTAWLAQYRSQHDNSSSVAPRSSADPSTKRP